MSTTVILWLLALAAMLMVPAFLHLRRMLHRFHATYRAECGLCFRERRRQRVTTRQPPTTERGNAMSHTISESFIIDGAQLLITQQDGRVTISITNSDASTSFVFPARDTANYCGELEACTKALTRAKLSAQRAQHTGPFASTPGAE